MTVQASTQQIAQLVHNNANAVVQGQQRALSTGTLLLYSYKDYVPKYTIVYTCHKEEADDLIMVPASTQQIAQLVHNNASGG